ncbi:MAG: DUF4058 family protein [Bacteroidota bacterium]
MPKSLASLFPGMDPYLEDYFWADVHNSLAFIIKEQLVPQLIPNYMIRLEVQTVKDVDMRGSKGSMYPDVEIFEAPGGYFSEPVAEAIYETPTFISPPTLSLKTTVVPGVSIPSLEIWDRRSNRLVTAIEILSPVNKEGDGLSAYLEKKDVLLREFVHLIEIDLLRAGHRIIRHEAIPPCRYMVVLTNVSTWKTDVWALQLSDLLPVVPVPLGEPNEFARLDLRKALSDVYLRSGYRYQINYHENPPPPALTEKERKWMREILDKELEAASL